MAFGPFSEATTAFNNASMFCPCSPLSFAYLFCPNIHRRGTQSWLFHPDNRTVLSEILAVQNYLSLLSKHCSAMGVLNHTCFHSMKSRKKPAKNRRDCFKPGSSSPKAEKEKAGMRLFLMQNRNAYGVFWCFSGLFLLNSFLFFIQRPYKRHP